MLNFVKIITVIFFALFSSAAYADTQNGTTLEAAMTGAQITSVLSGAKVIGKDRKFEQSFDDLTNDMNNPNGVNTSYIEGPRASVGQWKVIDNKYCSVWAQGGKWACYDMTFFKEGERDWVVWIATDGTRYEAYLLNK